METRDASHGDAKRDAAIAIGVFIAALAVYARTAAPTLSWQFDGADGGDLARAAALFSVPHPSGYPTYLLVSQLFLRLPFGEVAGRLSLMSAFWTACGVGAFVLARGVRGNAISTASSGFGALLLGLSPLVWSQALLVEVHGLQLFLVTVLLGAALWWQRARDARALWLAGLALGLALGNHLTILLLLPTLLSLMWRRDARVHLAVMGAAALILAALLYAMLMAAARFGTPSPWGDLSTPSALWSHVSGEIYRGFVFGVSPEVFVRRLSDIPVLLMAELSLPGVVLSVAGIAAQWQRSPRTGAAFAAAFAVSALFAAVYATADSRRYLLVALLCTAWWVADGAEYVWTSASAAKDRARVIRRWGLTVGAIAVLLLALARAPQMDLSGDRTVEHFATGVWEAAPPKAILLTESDRHTFALWYYTDVLGAGSGHIIVDRDLLGFAPYRAHLSARWGGTLADASTPADWLTRNGQRSAILTISADGNMALRPHEGMDAPGK